MRAETFPRRPSLRWPLLGATLLLAVLLAAGRATAQQAPGVGTEIMPPGAFGSVYVADAGGYVVAMAFAPDGRLFYTTKGGFGGPGVGQVRIVTDGVLRATPFLETPVETSGERGLLGIALDPEFATNRYVYIYKTAPGSETGTGRPSNQVIRYTEDLATQTAIPASKTILLDVPIGPENDPNTNHNGGNIHFGPDGKLYVTIGDYGRNPGNAQNLTVPMGKIHRFNADGSVPADNPIPGSSVWTNGNRNSFDFTFDPLTGRMFFTENGPEVNDEVNLGEAGGNYGWPLNRQGGTYVDTPPGTIAPLFIFRDPIGITGIEFYQGPIASWDGGLFWCDVRGGRLHHATLDESRTAIVDVRVVAGAPACRTDVALGPDGALYLASDTTISRVIPGHTIWLPLVFR